MSDFRRKFSFDLLLCSDRFRTMTNVLGDCIGTAIVEHMSRSELEHMAPLGADEENQLSGTRRDNRVSTHADSDAAAENEDGPLNLNLRERQTRM